MLHILDDPKDSKNKDNQSTQKLAIKPTTGIFRGEQQKLDKMFVNSEGS